MFDFLFGNSKEEQRQQMQRYLGEAILKKLKRHPKFDTKGRKFSIKLVLIEDDDLLDSTGSFATFSFKCNEKLVEADAEILRQTIDSVFVATDEKERVEAKVIRFEEGSLTVEGVLAIVRMLFYGQTEEEKEHSRLERQQQMDKSRKQAQIVQTRLG